MKFAEPLPRRGTEGEEDTEPSSPAVQMQRVITAIAADDKVVTFPAGHTLSFEESKALCKEVKSA